MCNIAGYSGDKQAAPILLEMLRKQELYDGDMSTGIATIHEGKMYSKKIVGKVEDFLREEYPLVDIGFINGQQGVYDFIISLE